MFNNRTRGIAITVFSMTVFTGPLLAPFIGGFITMSYLGWRWTEYIVAIMGFVAFGLNLLFLQETYPPVILVEKAEELRRRTRNWGIHAKQEEIEVDVRELIEKNFSRPIKMLISEPIVLLLSLYMAFIYGILYLSLTAYPIVFQGIYGMNLGVGGLPFFGMILGQLLAGLFIVFRQPGYQKKLAANNDMPIPEWRLPEVIIGGAAFAVGLFWFGWSGYRSDVHWIVPTLSGILTGFGLLSIFLQSLNYLVDAYLTVSQFQSYPSSYWTKTNTSSVRRLCHSCQHFPSIAMRLHIPPFRNLHVQRNGSAMGQHLTWLYCAPLSSRTYLVPP
jgi:DHA1 family multidrug resistance protein-like MFS transporter